MNCTQEGEDDEYLIRNPTPANGGWYGAIRCYLLGQDDVYSDILRNWPSRGVLEHLRLYN
jgi:hypothetical protein